MVSDPFAIALDAIFHAPGSVEAVYQPQGGGSTKAIRAIPRQTVVERGFVNPHRRVSGRLVDVRIADVAQPAVGDAILLNAAIYSVLSLPEQDAEGLTWTFDMPLLDRAIDILRGEAGDNEYGDPAGSFAASLTDLPASRADRSGREIDGSEGQGNQIASYAETIFLVPWTALAAGISPNDVVREDGRLYDISSVLEVGTRVGIEITAMARVG